MADLQLKKKALQLLVSNGVLTEEECKKCYAFRLCSMCATSCFDCEKDTLTAEQKLNACKGVKKRVDDFLLQYIISRENNK